MTTGRGAEVAEALADVLGKDRVSYSMDDLILQ
jgi:hypothetical protein